MSEGWVPSLRGLTFRFPLYPALSCRANECRPFGAGVCEAHSVSSPLVSFHLSIFSSVHTHTPMPTRSCDHRPANRHVMRPLAFIWKTGKSAGSIRLMFKLLVVMLSFATAASAADLPIRKHLNLAAIKTMVAAAEAEARTLNVEVTICIVDESGNLLFLEKADGASLNTIQFVQKKARHSATSSPLFAPHNTQPGRIRPGTCTSAVVET